MKYKYTILIHTLPLFFALQLSACNSGSTSVSSNRGAIQNILQKTVKYYDDKNTIAGNYSGISAAASCVNQEPVTYTTGSMAIGSQQLIATDSIFQIGSITKSFISVVVQQLSQQYNFSLDDTILQLDTDLAAQYPQWENVTIRELLNMTSGIPGYSNPPQAFDILNNYINNPTRYIPVQTLFDAVDELPVLFLPGEGFDYSNTNWILLGKIIHSITGHSPEQEVKQRIINVLNLKNTFFPIDAPSQVVNPGQLVTGYIGKSPRWPQIYWGMPILSNYSQSIASTGGAMISTPLDILNFINALYTPNILLNKNQLQELTTPYSTINGQELLVIPSEPYPSAYGLGIYILNNSKNYPNLGLVYTYKGETLGFEALYYFDSLSKSSMVLMINNSGPQFGDDSVAILAFSRLINLCTN